MFNETHDVSLNGAKLAFIKSSNIQVYPCGRRRSQRVTGIDKNGDGFTTDDEYYIPFDPEARLNTEANNRKHSGLNGFTQTYLNTWNVDEKLLSLSIAGYLFNIKLDTNYAGINDFCNNIVAKLGADTTTVYANILLEETPLFAGFNDYNTYVLRNQSDTTTAEASLDLLSNSADKSNSSELENPDNYYFSGLSFSSEPLSGIKTTRSTKTITAVDKLPEQVISLCILEKINDAWQIHEPARLPKIEHGDVNDSIKVGTLLVNNITQNGGSVPSMQVVDTGTAYQLQFTFGSNK